MSSAEPPSPAPPSPSPAPSPEPEPEPEPPTTDPPTTDPPTTEPPTDEPPTTEPPTTSPMDSTTTPDSPMITTTPDVPPDTDPEVPPDITSDPTSDPTTTTTTRDTTTTTTTRETTYGGSTSTTTYYPAPAPTTHYVAPTTTKQEYTPTTRSQTPVLSTTVIPTTITIRSTNSRGQTVTSQLVTELPTTTLIVLPPTETASSNSSQGAIIGGAVGGAAAFVLCVLLIIYCMRKRRDNNLYDDKDPIPWPDFNSHGIGSAHSQQGQQIMPANPDDDGMGGRLSGTEVGAGVVIPYQYNNDSRIRSPNDQRPISPNTDSTYNDPGYAGHYTSNLRTAPQSSSMAFATLSKQDWRDPAPPSTPSTPSYDARMSQQSAHSGAPLVPSAPPSSVGSSSRRGASKSDYTPSHRVQGSVGHSPTRARSSELVVHTDGGSVPNQIQEQNPPEELPPQYDTIPGASPRNER